MNRKVLIIGGVAGGASAAARLRRLDEDAHIVMFERGSHISFANCGLPYYIGDHITDRSKLLVQTPEAMYQRFNIDVRTESEVIAIDPAAKTVTVRSTTKGEYVESYDSIILSPGAKPIVPNLPGIHSSKIFTLRNMSDTDRIKEYVTKEPVRSAIVIGGGFIGVEMAENLNQIGLHVTLIEGGTQLLSPFDAEMSATLAKELQDHGVELQFSQRVESFAEDSDGIHVRTADGTTVTSDLVILAIGVTPDTSFLQGSGIELGQRGHIVVNDYLETNVNDIYAVGDAIEVTHFVNGMKTAIPLAGPANKQGRIVADNVCGLRVRYRGSQGTSIIKVFGLTAASTGLNEKTLTQLGQPYHITYVHPNSHASYYPGASPLTIKLLFNEDGTVLGAQAVGIEGVDKRIDDIAAVIHFKGTIYDLTELELAYAPPYSSAKDPVNMAGYTAENILAGRVNVFVPKDLDTRDPETSILIDVRTQVEHANGHIPGSIVIPVDELRDRIDELDPSKQLWVYCQVGLRGYTASRILQQKGFKVRNLTGGYKTFMMANYKPQAVVSKHSSERLSRQLTEPPTVEQWQVDAKLDACGLCCPGPLIQLKMKMDQIQNGQVLQVIASDPGFYEDVQAWTKMSKHQLLQVRKADKGTIEAIIRKTNTSSPSVSSVSNAPTEQRSELTVSKPEGSSMIVFSGDLDKAIASFIIANGAAASGKKVTMFFTFWGLNVIRRPNKVQVTKSLIGKMFGAMMPRGSRKLSMSRMNMMGFGPAMIRGVMKKANISSLEQLMQTAIDQGVEIVSCQMSMDVMGITKEELIDGVKIGGVGYYLGKADESGINLFI